MDATFCLGEATPAAATNRFGGCWAARARNAADGTVPESFERVARKPCGFKNDVKLCRSEVRQGIELQANPVGLNYRDLRAFATMITLTAGYPSVEWLQLLAERDYLSNAAAGIAIPEAQITFGVVHRQCAR